MNWFFSNFHFGEAMLVLKGVMFYNFQFGRIWWAYKTDFWQFLLPECVLVLKELI